MTPNSLWFPHLTPNDSDRLRLFCFPYAGGGTLAFRSWLDYFPSAIRIYPVELPGRCFRLQEPAIAQLQPLVREIARALYPYLDKPFAFFGHSMGALIGFELTRLLRKQHQISPIRLCVSGRCAPQIPPFESPIYHLPSSEFLTALRRLNGTPSEFFENLELMELALPILRADFAVVETYSYLREEPLSCPISVFGGLQDPKTTVNFLKAWQAQSTQDISLHLFSGDHFFIHSDRNEFLKLLVRDLQQSIFESSIQNKNIRQLKLT
ncbi:thioesterase [Oscillatoriales cyanobacterium LEGE 11467]|uniref:Thioesterase n=1 Tax=Zarconia navalis LEGE 11467 TaxID=1828826 RepID=A0A928Z7M0_9CYAN|nr:thioesterase domain-containing protein [Zarconia navalis]MBE9040675.1 thioesterase [Zarconia navalis LEGE 11467]